MEVILILKMIIIIRRYCSISMQGLGNIIGNHKCEIWWHQVNGVNGHFRYLIGETNNNFRI